MRILILFSLSVVLSSAGQAAKFEFSCRGKDAFSLKVIAEKHYIHPEAPLSLKLSSQNYKLNKSNLKRKDAKSLEKWQGKDREMLFTAKGKKTGDSALIKGNLVFYLCSKDICEQKKSTASCKP